MSEPYRGVKGCALPGWDTSTLDEPLVLAARKVGFLGPRGTFTEEALRAALAPSPGETPPVAVFGNCSRFLP